MISECWKTLGLALLGLLMGAEVLASDAAVMGAGASFPAPLIQAWSEQFAQEHKIEVSYRSVGSGEGIRRVTARAVDFALTDVPLTQAELAQDALMQFPMVVGAIVPVLNVPGVRSGDLRLDGPALADIFLGKIVKWNDAAIRALNPALELPDLHINVIHRSDSSGSSFVFTHYLSRVSPAWQERLGVGSRLRWPAGFGAKGNEGVSEMVRGAQGSIGYVEYSYALKYELATVQLANRAGNFSLASEASIRAALASADWSRSSFYEMLTDREGAQSWPIVGVSFVLIHRKQADSGDAQETLKLFDWIYHHGQALALALHYVGIEDKALIERIEASWKDIRDAQGHGVWGKK